MKGIYIPGGYPDRDTFRQYLKDIEQAGFDFVEIGIPFSEPVADIEGKTYFEIRICSSVAPGQALPLNSNATFIFADFPP